MSKNKYCICKKFKDFDKQFGGMKFLIATPQSLEGMDNYKGKYQLFRDIWGFKYCPFCKKKIREDI